MRLVKPEISGRHVHSDVHCGQFRRDFVEHLLLAVFFVEVRVILRAVVAVAILELQTGTIHRNFHPPEFAVHLRIRAAIAQHVVRRGVSLHSAKDAAEIVGIEKCLAAGVAR